MPYWLSLTWRDRSLYTKGPGILQTKSKNELIWHCHIIHFEQNQAETKLVLSLFWQTSSKELPTMNFLRGFVLAPKHLWATIGPWRLHNRWVCSGAPPSLTCDFFFLPGLFLIQQRSGRGTTSPSHWQHKYTMSNSWAATNISAPVRSLTERL